jgi:hypothetical protein
MKKSAKKKTRKKSGPQTELTSEKKEICFVIMPFGGWPDDYYDSIYSPAITSMNLEPHRADDLFRPSTITNDIWSYTKSAKLLLADLTGKNPNVFYELGLAHALAKPVILIAASMEDIPFDLRALRIIIYDKNAPNWGNILKKKIEASIKETIESPLNSVLPAFLDVKDVTPKPTVGPHQKEIIEIRQDLELLRKEIRSREDNHIDEYSNRRIEPTNKMGPMRASEIIKLYLLGGQPDFKIIAELTKYGVSKEWTQDEIKNIRKKERYLLSRAKTGIS